MPLGSVSSSWCRGHLAFISVALALLRASSFIPAWCFLGGVLAPGDGYEWCSTFARFHVNVLSFSVISFWRILCTFSRKPLMISFLGILLLGGSLTLCQSSGLVLLWWLPVLSMLTAPQCLSRRGFSRLIFLVLLWNLSLVSSPGVFVGTSTIQPNGPTSFRIGTCALFLSVLISPPPLPTTSALLPLWIIFFGPLTMPELVFRCWLLNRWISFNFVRWPQLICHPIKG